MVCCDGYLSYLQNIAKWLLQVAETTCKQAASGPTFQQQEHCPNDPQSCAGMSETLPLQKVCSSQRTHFSVFFVGWVMNMNVYCVCFVLACLGCSWMQLGFFSQLASCTMGRCFGGLRCVHPRSPWNGW